MPKILRDQKIFLNFAFSHYLKTSKHGENSIFNFRLLITQIFLQIYIHKALSYSSLFAHTTFNSYTSSYIMYVIKFAVQVLQV